MSTGSGQRKIMNVKRCLGKCTGNSARRQQATANQVRPVGGKSIVSSERSVCKSMSM